MLQLSRSVFENAQRAERKRHPEISEREAFLRTAARHLDRETMIRAYGWDPERASK